MTSPTTDPSRPTLISSPERDRQLVLSDDDVFVIEAWRDRIIEGRPDAIATASDEALLFITPIIGPTAALMAHRFAALTVDDQTQSFTTHELARTFGMGSSTARVLTTLTRLDRFGIAHLHGQTLAVRHALPPLNRKQIHTLPGYLEIAYRARRR